MIKEETRASAKSSIISILQDIGWNSLFSNLDLLMMAVMLTKEAIFSGTSFGGIIKSRLLGMIVRFSKNMSAAVIATIPAALNISELILSLLF